MTQVLGGTIGHCVTTFQQNTGVIKRCRARLIPHPWGSLINLIIVHNKSQKEIETNKVTNIGPKFNTSVARKKKITTGR